MKKCPFCGASIESSARFCLYCMQSLTEKEQIFPAKKRKPQWLLIIAATVVLALLSVIIWYGPLASKDGRPADSPGTPPVAEPSHIHSYSVENTASKYQVTAATCAASAVYYYSCVCGERGNDTFSYRQGRRV